MPDDLQFSEARPAENRTCFGSASASLEIPRINLRVLPADICLLHSSMRRSAAWSTVRLESPFRPERFQCSAPASPHDCKEVRAMPARRQKSELGFAGMQSEFPNFQSDIWGACVHA